ncbi:MAG: aminopeptidase [Thermoanaerobaculia bacterium]|nr:aminopeptidase [Thermoanaerobaculia bacterium]
MTATEGLSRTAALIVRRLLAVRPREQVALVCDPASEMGMVRALAREVEDVGGEFTILQQPDRELQNKNRLTPVIERGLEAADCLIGLTRSGGAPTYSAAVKQLLEDKRLRSISMVMRSLDNFTSGGALADYDELYRDGQALAELWRPARSVHLTAPAGTDLRASFGGQEVIIECGFATEPGLEAAFSDGEVSKMPAEGSAEGLLVIDGPIAHLGNSDSPVGLQVEAGRVVEVEGSGRVADGLRELFSTVEHASNIAEIGIGLNGACRRNGDFEEEKKARGNVHVAIGDNVFYGGDVRCAVHMDMVIYRPTVSFDGRAVVDEGRVLI